MAGGRAQHPSGHPPPNSRTLPGFLGLPLSSLTCSRPISICVSPSLEISEASVSWPLFDSVFLAFFSPLCLSLCIPSPYRPSLCLPFRLSVPFPTSSTSICLFPSISVCPSQTHWTGESHTGDVLFFPFRQGLGGCRGNDRHLHVSPWLSASYSVSTHPLPCSVPGESTLLLCKSIIFPVSSAAPLPEGLPDLTSLRPFSCQHSHQDLAHHWVLCLSPGGQSRKAPLPGSVWFGHLGKRQPGQPAP